MASYLVEGAIKGADFYLIDAESDLAGIAPPSDLSVAYIPNGIAYVFDYFTQAWTVFEDFRPESVFPLGFEPLEYAEEFGDAVLFAKADGSTSGDIEENDGDVK